MHAEQGIHTSEEKKNGRRSSSNFKSIAHLLYFRQTHLRMDKLQGFMEFVEYKKTNLRTNDERKKKVNNDDVVKISTMKYLHGIVSIHNKKHHQNGIAMDK